MACTISMNDVSVPKHGIQHLCFDSHSAKLCYLRRIYLGMAPVSCSMNSGGYTRASFTEKYGFPSVMVYSSLRNESKQFLQRRHCSLGNKSSFYTEWDKMTANIAGSSTIPFVLLQLPQIILNAKNLLADNKTALFAVAWLGQLTGLLGNLSLLSYFAKKREIGAIVVQTVGLVSNYVVVLQLAIAKAMPSGPFLVTSVAVASGLILNFLNYFGWLDSNIWRLWEDIITVGGLAILPQVMWSTFVPFLPRSNLPGLFSCAVAMIIVFLARTGKLSKDVVKIVESTSGWTATLLFMWMPIAQMWTNYLDPVNIGGLSIFSLLLAMIGNGLLIPRALFTRDLMWFAGSSWATLLYGWGNIFNVYIFGGINTAYFLTMTTALILWLGTIFWTDAKAYGLSSPVASFSQLLH